MVQPNRKQFPGVPASPKCNPPAAGLNTRDHMKTAWAMWSPAQHLQMLIIFVAYPMIISHPLICNCWEIHITLPYLILLTPLGINSLCSPSKWMLCNETVLKEKLSTQDHILKKEFYRTLEVLKCRSWWLPCTRGRLMSASKKDRPPTTSIYIDICWIKWFFL